MFMTEKYISTLVWRSSEKIDVYVKRLRGAKHLQFTSSVGAVK